jgi:hypothetical protein
VHVVSGNGVERLIAVQRSAPIAGVQLEMIVTIKEAELSIAVLLQQMHQRFCPVGRTIPAHRQQRAVLRHGFGKVGPARHARSVQENVRAARCSRRRKTLGAGN